MKAGMNVFQGCCKLYHVLLMAGTKLCLEETSGGKRQAILTPSYQGDSAAVTGDTSPTGARSQCIVVLSDGSSNESGLPGGHPYSWHPQALLGFVYILTVPGTKFVIFCESSNSIY